MRDRGQELRTAYIRWGDNDRYWGPFTYARERRKTGYRPFAAILSSGSLEEDPRCRLRLSAVGHTLIAALPRIVKPWRRKITANWDAATIERLGRNWYWDEYPREYGFSCSKGFLQVFYGPNTMDSSTDHTWGKFLPWKQWRHVRRSVYGLRGELIADVPDYSWRDEGSYERAKEIEASCPVAVFEFDDFDGERILATTRAEEREWLFGEGWFKWLSLFRKPKIIRSLDISFSSETGPRKGSWKGGTIGHSITMLPGELHEDAFRRYCAEHSMTFIGEVPCPQSRQN